MARRSHTREYVAGAGQDAARAARARAQARRIAAAERAGLVRVYARLVGVDTMRVDGATGLVEAHWPRAQWKVACRALQQGRTRIKDGVLEIL